MDKSPDAFRTISEVAEHLETPAHVLRFWESRFPQIRPVKRAGGRRYYRPSDVSLLTGIKRLLHDEGMTIRGVQKILREQGVRHVAGLYGTAAEDALTDADHLGDAGPFVEHIDEVVVPLRAEPSPSPRVPDLAAVMAKASMHGTEAHEKPPAQSTPSPRVEPVQGTLLLTPQPAQETVEEPVVADEANAESDDSPVAHVQSSPSDDDTLARVAASVSDPIAISDDLVAKDTAATEPVAASAPLDVASGGDESDFEDDDFDDGPVITLAARIRALPPDASAGRVGAELLAIVSRLRALRDSMAEASHTGRA